MAKELTPLEMILTPETKAERAERYAFERKKAAWRKEQERLGRKEFKESQKQDRLTLALLTKLRKEGRMNPYGVKGRKVKGGRSVTLRNMASVTIIRRSNGTVGIRGVKK